jgi:predicted phosphodiesterase
VLAGVISDTHGLLRPEAVDALRGSGLIIHAGGARKLYVLHDLATLSINPSEAGIAAVISGHSHKPSIEKRDGVLYLNPGSAGPRRFKLPISIAHIEIFPDRLKPSIIHLGWNAPRNS